MTDLLKKWECVLSDSPGHTSVLLHDIDTGQAPPVRSPPYQLPDVWREQVKEEIAGLSKLFNISKQKDHPTCDLHAGPSSFKISLLKFAIGQGLEMEMHMACLVNLGKMISACRGRHQVWRRELWRTTPHEHNYSAKLCFIPLSLLLYFSLHTVNRALLHAGYDVRRTTSSSLHHLYLFDWTFE